MSLASLAARTFGLKTTATFALASLGTGLVGGWVLHDRLVFQRHLLKEERQRDKQERVVAAAGAEGEALGNRHREELANRQERVRIVTREITKEIPIYVREYVEGGNPPAGNGTGGPPVVGDVSVGFRLLHDYAALGQAPPAAPPSGLDLDAASGVGMPALADTITYNYGVCEARKAELEQWRAWERDVRAWWQRTNEALGK